MLVLVVLSVAVAAAAGVGVSLCELSGRAAGGERHGRVDTRKVARGEYLSKHVSGCVECHAERDFTKYAGPGEAGDAREGGRAVRRSRNADSRALQQEHHAGRHWLVDRRRADSRVHVRREQGRRAAVSDHAVSAVRQACRARTSRRSSRTSARLKPIDYTAPARELGMPLPLIVRTMPAHADVPARCLPMTDRVAYGEYMTNAAVCGDCHTPIGRSRRAAARAAISPAASR